MAPLFSSFFDRPGVSALEERRRFDQIGRSGAFAFAGARVAALRHGGVATPRAVLLLLWKAPRGSHDCDLNPFCVICAATVR